MGSNPKNTSYQGTHTIHTGTDMYAVFNDMIVTTAQGVSYSVTRQKAPVYTLGSTDPCAVARSKRGIAGSMILTTFNQHCLSDFMKTSIFAAKKDSMAASDVNPNRVTGSLTPTTDAVRAVIDNLEAQVTQLGIDLYDTNPSLSISERTAPFFADQLLPFDVTLASRNEYDRGISMRIFGVEFLNEGSGISIDDTSNEVQLTYLARLLTPWVEEE